MSYQVESVLNAQAHLGECAIWSEREQVFYWVDILAPALNRFDPATGENRVYPMPAHIGCFGLRENGGFIVALRNGIFLTDAEGNIEKQVGDNPTDHGKSRFNDGHVDLFGNFWAGTIWEPRDHKGGKLVRVKPTGECEVMAGDVLVSNGLGFSPNGKWMFHTDTPNHILYRYPLDENGNLGEREVLREFERGTGGRPDGAAFDSEGYYWTAMFDGGRVLRIHPETGETVDEIKLPVRWPTMVAFGGADLKTLYITSSRENRSAEELAEYPLSGNVFAVRVNVAGRPEPLYRG